MPPAEPAPGRWIHAALEIGQSRIAGRGVFATSPLLGGSAVARFAQPVLAVDGLGQLNHSCDPNLWWADEWTLVTRRDIDAGSELTTDYGTTTGRADFVMMCHCDTYRCRQLIAGDDWRIPQLQQRYAGHWAPHLQRLIDRAP